MNLDAIKKDIIVLDLIEEMEIKKRWTVVKGLYERI